MAKRTKAGRTPKGDASSTEQPENQQALFVDPTLKTLFCDNVNFALHGDGLVLLHVFSKLPVGAMEQARLMVTRDHAKRIVLALCKTLDYHPEREEIDAYSKTFE